MQQAMMTPDIRSAKLRGNESADPPLVPLTVAEPGDDRWMRYLVRVAW